MKHICILLLAALIVPGLAASRALGAGAERYCDRAPAVVVADEPVFCPCDCTGATGPGVGICLAALCPCDPPRWTRTVRDGYRECGGRVRELTGDPATTMTARLRHLARSAVGAVTGAVDCTQTLPTQTTAPYRACCPCPDCPAAEGAARTSCLATRCCSCPDPPATLTVYLDRPAACANAQPYRIEERAP